MLNEFLRDKAKALRLYGLLANWDTLNESDTWVEALLAWEEAERNRRSLENRMSAACIGHFKPLADFDWNWPTQCDKPAILDLMALGFLQEAANAVIIGPNGIGKSTIVQNIAYQAVIKGHTVRFTTASKMLNELAAQEGALSLKRRLTTYTRPSLLVIDEVGYLSYGTRHADLLFEIVSSRYENKSTLVTTNKPFSEWNDVFPNASCVVSLVDRLLHNADIITLEGKSYRLKEAAERNARRKAARANRKEQK